MGAVYFAQADDECGPIKIGVTQANVFVRLAQIVQVTRRRIALLGAFAGDEDAEAGVHEAFAHLRIAEPFPRGGIEWFRCDPELVDFARALPPLSQTERATSPRPFVSAADSRGSLALRRFFSQLPLTQSEVARRLGVSQQAVSAWKRGIAAPDAHRRTVLAGLIGVPAEDWDIPADMTADDTGS